MFIEESIIKVGTLYKILHVRANRCPPKAPPADPLQNFKPLEPKNTYLS